MAVTLQHNDLVIEVFDDPAFNQNPDSPTSYDRIYMPGNDKDYRPAARHAIVVYRENVKIASAILLAVAGAASVTPDAVLIDNDNLVTRCCNTVFCLTLPSLDLKWMTEADWVTCFSIHRYEDTYITHGETSVARIDRNGNKCWSYGGADIFVRLEAGNAFEMHDDHIEMMDFNGSTYKIDYNGNTIQYNESDYYRQEPVYVCLKNKKPWWKCW